MKLDKINIIMTGILIILIVLFFIFGRQEVIFNDNSTLEKIDQLKEEIAFLEESFGNKNDGTKTQLIQINGKEDIHCALVIKEHGTNGKLTLYDYTGNGELGSIEDIAIDGYDYLKTLGGSKHHIYSGVQCKKDNGWTLINGKSNEYSIKEINGDMVVVKDEFIQENGYFSQRGDVQITCCRIV